MRTLLILSMTLLAMSAPTAQHQSGHDHAAMNARGDQVMGFEQDKTTHHFRLTPDGGEIEVGANDPKGTASAEQIRTHLRHIARKFAEGDFNAPFLIHAQTVPGTDAMTRLKKEIAYAFESDAAGGRIRISTRNGDALKAIHEFLRFQIAEHRTGDLPTAAAPKK